MFRRFMFITALVLLAILVLVSFATPNPVSWGPADVLPALGVTLILIGLLQGRRRRKPAAQVSNRLSREH